MCRRSSVSICRRNRSSRTCRPICWAILPTGSHVLEHLDTLVVKAVGESGGYGMLVGPHSTRGSARSSAADPCRPAQLHRAADARLSRAACFLDDGIEPRHVDLRPYVLYGERVTVVPGGLTRVALARDRLSSTRPRAAAARTPGCCWTEVMLLSRVADAFTG